MAELVKNIVDTIAIPFDCPTSPIKEVDHLIALPV